MDSKKPNSTPGSLRVICGAICLGLFLSLAFCWARSYQWCDEIRAPKIGSFKPTITSYNGSLAFSRYDCGWTEKWKRKLYKREPIEGMDIVRYETYEPIESEKIEIAEIKAEIEAETKWVRKSLRREQKEVVDKQAARALKLLTTIGNSIERLKQNSENRYYIEDLQKKKIEKQQRLASLSPPKNVMPFWLPVLATGCLTVVCGWKQRWRLSLKTMLILTAVVAGFVVAILGILRM